ncbi:MAG: hypothetical protein L3K52_11455 [Candidatus Thiothrix sulfatifontis]|nr:MAG: hypothetical protein L3K52_11455 [Candidatus Thiothrix sulfatifontis]
MKRYEIEHLIRAAGAITQSNEIIVIGSQSILGSYPEAPAALLQSREADLIPVQYPERADLIDGVLGELSPFDETFGYYADGVDKTTAILPEGWESRLIRIANTNTNNVVGLFLEPHDLMTSKLYAGREKDMDFVATAIRSGIVDANLIRERINKVSGQDAMRDTVLIRLERLL